MAAVVINLVHVRVTNAGGRAGLSIANHEVFIAGAVNIALYFRAIVERDRRGAFDPTPSLATRFLMCSIVVAGLSVFWTAPRV